MATQTLPALHENYVALTRVVKRWDRRLRLQQTLLWLPRSLLPGLGIGLVLAAISWLRPWLLPQQIGLIAGALLLLGMIVFVLAIWLWRRPVLLSAQRFDHRLGFNERVSTALELGAQSIHSNDELTQGQMAFAREKASAVRIGEHLPMMLRRRDWALVIAMAALLALLLLLPNPQADALSQASIQQQAINNAADQLRETTQDIAADTSLGNEQRRTLLEQLKTATNTLDQPNITPQEALAAVSSVQSNLQNNADQLNQQSRLNQSALQQAANALRQASANSNNPQQSGASMEQAAQNLNQMAQDVPNMTQAQQQAAQQALQNAAQALQNTNPQAAQQMQQAAQQLQQGNTQQAQQQLQQASQQMQQQMQQTQQQQQAAQNLNNAAQQAQQSGQQISQAQQQNQQGQQSQQNQQSQQGQPQSQQSQQQSQGQQQGQQNQQGQQSNQEGQQGQQGQQQSQQGQQASNQQGQQPGQQNQPGEQSGQQSGQQPGDQGQQGQQGQQSGQSTTSQQTGALSAGDQSGDPHGDDNGQQQSAVSQGAASNNPDGTGQRDFEAVNVPRRIGPAANDGNNVQLNPDASNTPIQEGDFVENPNGQVTVPYNQVFSDYANAANQALNSDYVPLGLRDVVRDYFTSLEPKP